MARLEVLVAVVLVCLGHLSSPAVGSTITEKFNAEDIISFLHDLPRYDLSLSQASNVFDPGSWTYDQTMIWFVAPGVLVLLLTLGLAIILAIRKCVLGCLREAAANEGEETDGGFDSFPVLPVISRGMVMYQGPTLPRWVRTVHILTFVLMVLIIGVVIVTWLASFDFFNFVHNSYQPVDKANELLNTGFGYVNTSLSVSLAGLQEVAQLNATFESIRADVITLRNSVTPLAAALDHLPNIAEFVSELKAWHAHQVVDMPTALPPIYANLVALNASLASMPVSTTNALARLKLTVDMSQFEVAQQYIQLVLFAGQPYTPLLDTTRAAHNELQAMEERTRQALLPVEASLVKAVLAGGANPSLSDDITALARQIQQNYVQKGDAINALPSMRQLVVALLGYSGLLPDAISRSMDQMRADYEAYVQDTPDMANLLAFLEAVGPFDPAALAGFVKQQVPPVMDRLLAQYLETPPGLRAAYANWDQQTHDLSGQMNSYHKIQDQVNKYLPEIESVVDKVELSRFILFNVECAWMVLACLLSLLAIFRPRLQSWLMAMLFLALVLAGVEMVVYLPPAVFTSDFCVSPDNYTLSQVSSSASDATVVTYARYYIYCGSNETIDGNNSSDSNPLLPYTAEVREALLEVEPMLANLNNISAVVIGTRPIVNLLSEQLLLTLQEIGKLEQLSNCSTIHPLYEQMKTNVCHDLTPAVFLLFVDRGVLVALMVLVVLGSIATLSYHNQQQDGRGGYTILSGRPRRSMTEAYLGGVPLARAQVGMSATSINAVDNVNVNVQRP